MKRKEKERAKLKVPINACDPIRWPKEYLTSASSALGVNDATILDRVLALVNATPVIRH